MNDTDGKKPLGLGGAPRSGQVKQSFSHGRTKSVVVEVKRKLPMAPGKSGVPGAAATATTTQPRLGDPSKRPAGISDAEMERRLAALRAARAREVEENARRASDELQREQDRARRREEIDAKDREEKAREAAARAKVEEETRVKQEAEAVVRRAEEAKKAPVAAAPAPRSAAVKPAATQTTVDARGPASAKPGLAPRKTDRDREDRDRAAKAKPDENRRVGKLTLNEALAGDGGRTRSLAAM